MNEKRQQLQNETSISGGDADGNEDENSQQTPPSDATSPMIPKFRVRSEQPVLPGEEKLTSCGCDKVAGQVDQAVKPKAADPLEPIPLEETMDQGVLWGMPTLEKGMDASESESHNCDTAVVEDTDDEEDRAMVAWATEFVHCPRCSLVQGRGDFDELPIQDIRKALIG